MSSRPRRNDDRVILHFDYDCFYAQVAQNRDPETAAALAGKPVAVTQKSILATCNYVARGLGVRKLMHIPDARQVCPELVLVDGEDLSPFRDASKQLYRLVRAVVGPSAAIERLGLDEVYVDVTRLVDYNMQCLPPSGEARARAFFQLSEQDPESGFDFDARSITGCVFGPDSDKLECKLECQPKGPSDDAPSSNDVPLSFPCSFFSLTSSYPSSPATEDVLTLRLLLGSHLAAHLRRHLEREAGYTASAGIATSKLLAKLAGKRNKPANQTVMLSATDSDDAVWAFMDPLPLRSVPGIGFKTSSLLSHYILSEWARSKNGDNAGDKNEDEDAADPTVTVRDVRCFPGMSTSILDSVLGSNTGPHFGPGSGASHGNVPTGAVAWALLHGVDDSPVKAATTVPAQISIEDTYAGLRKNLLKPEAASLIAAELKKLATSLLRRMYADLATTEEDESGTNERSEHRQSEDNTPKKRWMVRPKTLRLAIRPQVPATDDSPAIPVYHFMRTSRSQPLPGFVLNLSMPPEQIVDRLVAGSLVPMYRKLASEVQIGGRSWTGDKRKANHGTGREGDAKENGAGAGADKAAWTVGLLNVCVANMVPVAGGKDDIASLFRRGHDLGGPPMNDSMGKKDTADSVRDTVFLGNQTPQKTDDRSNEINNESNNSDSGWDAAQDSPDDQDGGWEACHQCGHFLPVFAMAAHDRYHLLGDE